jgi:hypothetical protein
MGGIVIYHVLHQSQQLVHRGVAAGCAAAVAIVAAFVGMVVRMAVLVQMIVVMGMLVIVGVAMGMFVGMGNTVVGVLMGVGMVMGVAVTAYMLVINMHRDISFIFSFIILGKSPCVKGNLCITPQALAQSSEFRRYARF